MSPPLYQLVVDDIRARIASGALKPGDKLPRIADMAESYGVGQTTVKTALMILNQSGHIEGQQGKASFVSALNR